MRQRKLKWAEDFLKSSDLIVKDFPCDLSKKFPVNQPIELEIGCGKGVFILKKALANPNINYIGIDIQSSILAIAAKKIEENGLSNVRFAFLNASTLSQAIINKVSFIYLNFSDPWPKAKHAKRRLTSPLFLQEYDKILEKDGLIVFRTDNQGLYEYSSEVFAASSFKVLENVPNCPLNDGDIISEYETKFRELGQPINKIVVQKE